MQDVIIRCAQTFDAEGIGLVVNPIIRDTAITFTTLEKKTHDLSALIEREPDRHFVVVRDGQVLGYATFFQFRNGPGYAKTLEHSISLAPEARGLGVGRKLMSAIETAAREQGAHSLFAGVSSENPNGAAFHAAVGFTEVCTIREVGFKFGRWIDLILMQKFL